MSESIYDRINDYGSVKISLASPADIRSWSYGEVKKPETINYRTYRAEKDGLFCERIFGPERDWECFCGKYKGMKHKGIICDRCGVKVTHSRVRRKRMGHITLAAPVVHIWFFKAMPSRLGTLLGMKTSTLERIIYYQDYVVTDPGDTPLKEKQLLSEDEYRACREKYGDEFEAGMGAEAIRALLQNLDDPNLVTGLIPPKHDLPSHAEHQISAYPHLLFMPYRQHISEAIQVRCSNKCWGQPKTLLFKRGVYPRMCRARTLGN